MATIARIAITKVFLLMVVFFLPEKRMDDQKSTFCNIFLIKFFHSKMQHGLLAEN